MSNKVYIICEQEQGFTALKQSQIRLNLRKLRMRLKLHKKKKFSFQFNVNDITFLSKDKLLFTLIPDTDNINISETIANNYEIFNSFLMRGVLVTRNNSSVVLLGDVSEILSETLDKTFIVLLIKQLVKLIYLLIKLIKIIKTN